MKFSAVILFFVSVLCLECGICTYANKANNRTNVSPKYQQNFTIKYSTDSVIHNITIPIKIHLDKVLLKGLSQKYKKTVKNYFRDVLHGMEKLFRHPSLNQTIYFDLLNIKFLRNASKEFEINDNVSKYLNSYCQWQGKKKIEKKKWYYSVLFTGLDLFYIDERRNKNRSSTGRGYMRGVCSLRNSCTLLEWHPQHIVNLLAHEIAHSLGISHDGPPDNRCYGQRYIMGTNYTRTSSATWSPCNERDLEKFLLSKHSWCLQPNSRFETFNLH